MSRYLKKLADDYAKVCEQISDLERWKKDLRARLLEHERPVYEGHYHKLALTVGTRATLDRKAIERDVGEIPATWLKSSVTRTIRVLS